MSPADRRDAALSSRLFVALATPVGLLVLVGIILTFQIVRMQQTAEWVARSDEQIAKITALQKQIIDQETGLRGYLVTDDPVFLEPYLRAHPNQAFADLRAFFGDNAAQKERVDEVRRRYDSWLAASATIAQPGANLAEFRTTSAMIARKQLMDAIRDALAALLAAERDLHTERVASSTATYRGALYALTGLLIALAASLGFLSRRHLRAIADTYTEALANERVTRRVAETESWIRKQHGNVSKATEGDPTLDQLGRKLLDELIASTGAVVAALYATSAAGWQRCAGHALDPSAPPSFADAEGIVGEAARGGRVVVVGEVPENYLKIRSGTGEGRPTSIVLVPARVDGKTWAVAELGFFGKVEARCLELFERIGETIAVAVRSVEHQRRLRDLLEESQQQAEELQAQQEELETQQEELRVSNEELRQQSDTLLLVQAQLAERKEELETTNSNLVSQRDELAAAQTALTDKATELERVNRYKSEFLANMSHELRTPLNSTLILAKLLADNKHRNLTEEQIKFAKTIHDASSDLLALINDILDLSKIEAGKLEVHPEATTVARLVEPLVSMMEPLAAEKQLGLSTNLPNEGAALETDPQRAQQIILNLLSNALKFTEQGGVTLEVTTNAERVEIAVTDTGIGIPKHQQELIFDAFRQADGTTNRRYGGTGLGLSISRDLARLLGGELTVTSEPGQGSRFVLDLPCKYAGPRAEADAKATTPTSAPARPLPNPGLTPTNGARARKSNGANRRPLLIVEDDERFAEIIATLGQELEFECSVACTADDGVRQAIELHPAAIVLDLKLPDHSGLSVLDRLKRNPTTRHIPIHIISANADAQTALSMGAIGYLTKPVSRDDIAQALLKLKQPFTPHRRVLVVEDDAAQREAIVHLLGAPEVDIVAVATVGEALSALSQGPFDCVVTDLSLPDASGYDLLEKMANDDAYAFPRVVVYTGRSLTRDEEQRLRRYSRSVIVKGAHSPERLLDEITLFLHQIESELPPERRRMLKEVRDRETVFDGKKVLLAEDDVRNIFALTSVLEPRGVNLVVARTGKEALDAIETTPDIDLALMDIMMPEMDGLSAIEHIRKRNDELAKMPIIALTAKAMRDDQERCLAAGANDFVPKPLDLDVLLSLMRVWMPK